MGFEYKNPVSTTIIQSEFSVNRENVKGTNFSVLGVGGYMEVYSLSDLNWTIPPQILIDGGTVYYSGNTIPINFSYNVPFAFQNELTLNNDGISSGRRRLGMQVYVLETDTVYQYTMTGFTAMFDAADVAGSIFPSSDGYVVSNDTPEGDTFINAWTGSTIEGVSGITKNNARWQIFFGTDIQITGGTYYSGITTLDLYNNTGGTISITGFTGTVTGGTYDSGTSTLSLNNSDGSNVVITGLTSCSNCGISVGDGTTTVSSVTGITFIGASVVNDGGGDITVTITGAPPSPTDKADPEVIPVIDTLLPSLLLRVNVEEPLL